MSNSLLRTTLAALGGLLLCGATACSPAHAQASAAEQLTTAFNRGEQHRARGELGAAIREYETAVRLAPHVYGAEDVNTANLINNLALLYQEHGYPRRAEPLYRQSLAIYQKQLPANDRRIATAQNNLGDVYRILSDYERAEQLYRLSLKAREATLGPDHLDVAQVLNSLGILHLLRGELVQSDAALRRALKIREDSLGKDHADVAIVLMSLGALNRQLGQDAAAEAIFQRVIAIRENRLGPDHPDTAAALLNLGSVQASMGQPAKALPVLQRSLKSFEQKHGREHQTIASAANSIGEVQRALGEAEAAEASFLRALAIWEKLHGKEHPNVAVGLHNLALIHASRGQVGEADVHLRRAQAILTTVFGEEHPRVAEEWITLALLRASQGGWGEAGQFADRARRISRRHVARTLPVLAESEQLRFLTQKHEPELHQALSLALSKDAAPGLTSLSASWILNGKAIAQEALAESSLLARDSADPALAEDLKQLTAVRRKLANRSFDGSTKVTPQELAQLTAQEQEISRRLRRASGHQDKAEPWVELDAVRQLMQKDSVLVEIARLRPFDPASLGKPNPWRQPRYAAWIIPPAGKGAVRLVDLGPASEIESQVSRVRQMIQAAPDLIRSKGERESERELLTHLNALAARILHPLLPHAGHASHWIISPDADLWLAPWSALPLPSGKYLIEDHRVSLVVSGRDLLNQPLARAVTRPLIVADPDYDLDRTTARRIAEQVAQTAAGTRTVRFAAQGPALPAVQRLPGTAREARQIAPSLASYTATTPQLLMEKQAQERLVKSVRSPRVLVLSTHGFFLEDQRTNPAVGGTRFVQSTGKGPSNPLLRCGLLFAGVNRREQATADDEDGILTGLEIVGLDLRGTEMVVLSACETGIGRVHNGEGVAGLRQAFQLAGAHSVLSTLWQIDDQASADLVTGFFSQLAAKQPRPDALRAAQLQLLKARREKSGSAHPFYWAAYTLTGE